MYLTPAFFGKHPSTRVKVRPHDGCDWPTFAARPLTNDVRFCPCLPKSVTSSVLALPRFCPYLGPGLTRQNCRRSTTIPPSFIVSLISSQSFLFFLIPPFLSPLSRALSLFLCLSEWRPQLASAYGNAWRPAGPADIRFRPFGRNVARSGKNLILLLFHDVNL